MLYRIWTENKNPEQVADIVRSEFCEFSMSNHLGYWRGVPEPSLLIELDVEPWDAPRVETVAQRIKAENNQDAVLIQRLPIESLVV